MSRTFTSSRSTGNSSSATTTLATLEWMNDPKDSRPQGVQPTIQQTGIFLPHGIDWPALVLMNEAGRTAQRRRRRGSALSR